MNCKLLYFSSLLILLLCNCQKPHLLPETMLLELEDGNGLPVVNAQVKAGQIIPDLFSPFASLEVLETKYTNNEGLASFSREHGNLQIEVDKPGYCPIDDIRREELSTKDVSKTVVIQKITPVSIVLDNCFILGSGETVEAVELPLREGAFQSGTTISNNINSISMSVCDCNYMKRFVFQKRFNSEVIGILEFHKYIPSGEPLVIELESF